MKHPDDLAERLQRIESQLLHLERQVDALNEVVAGQTSALQRIQRLQQRLADSIEAAELDRLRQTNPKPPHYQ